MAVVNNIANEATSNSKGISEVRPSYYGIILLLNATLRSYSGVIVNVNLSA